MDQALLTLKGQSSFVEQEMKTPIVHCKKIASTLIPCAAAFLFLTGAGRSWASSLQAQNAPPDAQAQMQGMGQPTPAPLTPEQLQDLVSPIALYPDALVAQILAASTYPTQIVEADRFLEQNPDLTGAALGNEVDKQDWDPSVKALTQFPSVLADLDKNLSWTSELGDADYNQQADVMAAIQVMRRQAETAGNLQTTPQQSVTNQGSTIVIQPENPDVVYVPDYDPELVYGYPIGLWPGFYPWWDVQGPFLSFGIGFGVSPFFGFGWGWNAWGCNWYNRGLMYGGGPYGFHSHAFYDRNAYFHGNYRGNYSGNSHGNYRGNYRGSQSFARGNSGLRGFRAQGGMGNGSARSGAFGAVTRGGNVRGYASRGMSSMGGGMRGGGGGMRGGGMGGGGHR